MIFKKITFILILLSLSFISSSCMLTYLAKSGYSQMKILASREPINEVIANKNLTQITKEKLNLVIKVRDFCFNELKLKKTKNYSSFVQLKDNYVSYLLRVAPKYKLESYKWSFPIVGSFPYLGFFNKNDALDEEKKFIEKNYDTYVRGVTAFSTLGWFNDPVLSSMMRYDDSDLVDLIIHETIHTTLFIKNQASFNEKLATYLASVGTELFYKKLEGDNSPTIKKINLEHKDDKIFSKFITKEFSDLKSWYAQTKNINETSKKIRLKQINNKFILEIKPQLNTNKYDHFAQKELNNANLLPYKTYLSDLSDFEKLHIKLGSSFHKTLEFLKTLENVKNAEASLKQSINTL